MTTTVKLFGTFGCHLCEQAQTLLVPYQQRGALEFEDVDILDDPALEARYGVRIPVLLHPDSGLELDWPFDDDALARFLARIG